jgi:calcineurin-like phosphoesterase family protein
MKTWFISDLHIDHNNILKYSNRPFKDIQEMQESFISNWNSVVAEGVIDNSHRHERNIE